MNSAPRTLLYQFDSESGTKEFIIKLENPSMSLQAVTPDDLPDWTLLKTHQCANCPLSPLKHKRCPIAVNLVELIDFFKNSASTENAEITITNDDRQYRKRASLQYGVRSLMGVYMVSSGCPVMDKLRPMVYTHLPFPTIDETRYRSVAMYLIAQFLKFKRGEKPDWELDELVDIYKEVGIVNRAFSERLRSINPEDASLNAIANLDTHGSYTAMSITENYLDELEQLFAPYLGEEPKGKE